MKLVLICDEEKIFEGEVSEVGLITDNGPISILPHHQPYMTKISHKVSYITAEDEKLTQEIDMGFAYTDGDICFVVVDK